MLMNFMPPLVVEDYFSIVHFLRYYPCLLLEQAEAGGSAVGSRRMSGQSSGAEQCVLKIPNNKVCVYFILFLFSSFYEWYTDIYSYLDDPTYFDICF